MLESERNEGNLLTKFGERPQMDKIYNKTKSYLRFDVGVRCHDLARRSGK